MCVYNPAGVVDYYLNWNGRPLRSDLASDLITRYLNQLPWVPKTSSSIIWLDCLSTFGDYSVKKPIPKKEQLELEITFGSEPADPVIGKA